MNTDPEVQETRPRRASPSASCLRARKSTPGGMRNTPPLDVPRLMDRLGGDRELLRELVEFFLEDNPLWLEEILRSIEEQNAGKLRASAHLLLGSLSSFSASPASLAARRLEDMGKSGDLSAAPEAYHSLVAELKQLQPALIALAELPISDEQPR